MGVRLGRGLRQRLSTWWKASAWSQKISHSLPPKLAEFGDPTSKSLAPYFRNPRLPRRAVTHNLSGLLAHKVAGSTQRRNELHESVTRATGDTHDALRRSLDELEELSPDPRVGRTTAGGL